MVARGRRSAARASTRAGPGLPVWHLGRRGRHERRMIGFRQCDPRFPYLWEGSSQPAGRWHAEGEGPAHYFADTPDGAWAELLRHEEITDPADLATVRRAIWAVDLGDTPAIQPAVPADSVTGSQPASAFATCQAAAREARAAGHERLEVPSAA